MTFAAGKGTRVASYYAHHPNDDPIPSETVMEFLLGIVRNTDLTRYGQCLPHLSKGN